MYCPNCGREIPDDSTHCTSCGASFQQDTQHSDKSTPQGKAKIGWQAWLLPVATLVVLLFLIVFAGDVFNYIGVAFFVLLAIGVALLLISWLKAKL